MELRQVEYALAVADHGSFSRAAVAMFVTQPSLSQGIAKLERELGVRLFVRLGRRVTLSPAGEAFVVPARQMMRDASNARAAAEAVRGLEAGHLDLVSLPTLAIDPVAELIGRFRRTHPGILVRLAESEDPEHVAERVRTGASEVGVTELPVNGSDLRSVGLLSQEILAVFPPGTQLALRRGRLPVERLAGVPLVTTPEGTSTRRSIGRALASANIEPVIAVETSHREALLPLVAAGAGTTFLPRGVAERSASAGFVMVPLVPRLRRQVGAIARREPASPAAERFLRMAGDRPVAP
jgi:LysR family carnitine catabolism transcriptional activator